MKTRNFFTNADYNDAQGDPGTTERTDYQVYIQVIFFWSFTINKYKQLPL